MKQKLIGNNIKLENCNIYWEGGLASNSAPIVFLPGWSVSAATYLESLNALSERHHLIAPDLPGFCKSTSPKFLQSYDDYANCIIDFLDRLNIKKAHLMGHFIGEVLDGSLGILADFEVDIEWQQKNVELRKCLATPKTSYD